MELLKAHPKQRKKAIKRVIKKAVRDKNTHGFVKACYYITWLLRIYACLSGVIIILKTMFIRDEVIIDVPALIIRSLFPFMFSYAPAIVYIISLGKEFYYRRRESLTLKDNGFVYAYHDDRLDIIDEIFSFNINYDQLTNYEYCEETKVLDLSGEITVDTYVNGKLKESDVCKNLSMFDIYDINLNELLKERFKGGKDSAKFYG